MHRGTDHQQSAESRIGRWLVGVVAFIVCLTGLAMLMWTWFSGLVTGR